MRAERAKLWVALGTSGAKEFEDGRKRQAALTQKEAERFGILQSKRSEHSHGGNCTAGSVQGQQAGRATRAALNLSTPT